MVAIKPEILEKLLKAQKETAGTKRPEPKPCVIESKQLLPQKPKPNRFPEKQFGRCAREDSSTKTTPAAHSTTTNMKEAHEKTAESNSEFGPLQGSYFENSKTRTIKPEALLKLLKARKEKSGRREKAKPCVVESKQWTPQKPKPRHVRGKQFGRFARDSLSRPTSAYSTAGMSSELWSAGPRPGSIFEKVKTAGDEFIENFHALRADFLDWDNNQERVKNGHAKPTLCEQSVKKVQDKEPSSKLVEDAQSSTLRDAKPTGVQEDIAATQPSSKASPKITAASPPLNAIFLSDIEEEGEQEDRKCLLEIRDADEFNPRKMKMNEVSLTQETWKDQVLAKIFVPVLPALCYMVVRIARRY